MEEDPHNSNGSDQGFGEKARITEIWPERLQKNGVKEIIGGEREREREVEEEQGCGCKLIL